jgi:crotonobetainyl-CoA:carnitine CoA-transferase CaiB-like acyl-CoA transferase
MPKIQGPPVKAGQHTDAVLSDYGFSIAEVARLRAAAIVG